MAAPSGIVWGSTVGSYGRIGIYTDASNTATETTVSVEIWVWTKYSVSDSSNTLYYNNLASSGSATTSVGSVSVSTTVDTGDGWSTSNQKKLKSYSYTYTRKTSASTRYLYAKLANIDRVGGTMYASTTVSVPKLDSYTVKYDANGGSGAPSSQTKWYGTTLTLSSTKPSRTGYTFQGWALTKTDADAGTWYYQPGGTCGKNENLTLYAVWTANTYTVTYNANGGSGAPAKQTKTYGVALTLSSTKPTRTNYTFKGWGTSASATTVSYAAGAKYTANSAVTLYAVWELAYTKPRISNFSVSRCDSTGLESDTGTCALVMFNWACDQEVSSVKIEWRLNGTSSWTNSVSIDVTGTSGTVNTIVGEDGLSSDRTYVIRVTVSDSSDSSNSTKPLNGTSYPIDVKSGGTGIAFGKPAEYTGYADIAFKVRLRDNMIIPNNSAIYGRNVEDDTSMSLIYVNTSNNTVVGYGGYYNNIGTTNIYGNEVRFTSRTGVYVGGCQIAVNNVLWSGKWYMNADQTATLTGAVSKQANGIVLIWSEYADGDAVNDNFNMCFVPKQFVSTHSARSTCLTLTSAKMNVVAAKCVFISDTSILGYENNGAAAATMSCGIKATPKNFVLRYVIGV